jgi:hypothetical protein
MLDDDDDDDRPSPRPERPNAPSTQPGVTQRIQRELRIGHVWVKQQGSRPIALRASLEVQGRTVAALDLEPRSAQPLPLDARATVAPETRWTLEGLRIILERLRASSPQALQVGRLGVLTERGIRLPVFWRDVLVTYLYVGVGTAELLGDSETAAQIRASQWRVR